MSPFSIDKYTAHSAGATIPQIALAEQIDTRIVQATLRRHGIPYPRGRHPLDHTAAARLADPAWLAAEYAAKSAPEIAGELGCAANQVFCRSRRNWREREWGARTSPGTWVGSNEERGDEAGQEAIARRGVSAHCSGSAPAMAKLPGR